MTVAALKQVSIRVKLALLVGCVIGLVVLGQTFQTLSAEAIVVQENINFRARLTLMSLASAIGPLWTDENVPRLEPFIARIAAFTATGQTRTYGELAEMLDGPPGASRAIGAALGANPWPLIVPCHRILGAKGRLIGFSAAGGVVTKARLLVIEGAQLLAE